HRVRVAVVKGTQQTHPKDPSGSGTSSGLQPKERCLNAGVAVLLRPVALAHEVMIRQAARVGCNHGAVSMNFGHHDDTRRAAAQLGWDIADFRSGGTKPGAHFSSLMF